MSALSRADAVVLRTMKYRDTSLIVTFLTREYGKLAGVVKGARRTKGGFGSPLQPMTRVQAMVYRKEGRDLQTIGSCDLIESYRHIQEDIVRMAAGMKLVELVSMIAHEEEDPELFDLVVGALGALDGAPGDPETLFHWSEIAFAAHLGFELTFHSCAGCDRPKAPTGPAGAKAVFHLERGGILCGDCAGLAGEKMTVRRSTIDLLDRIAGSAGPVEAMALPVKKEDHAEMDTLLWSFLRRHVAGLRPLRSGAVFAKILPDP